jgi:hypothetical protein
MIVIVNKTRPQESGLHGVREESKKLPPNEDQVRQAIEVMLPLFP